MLASNDFQTSLEQAASHVEDDPLHRLSPWHRLKIYEAIGPLTNRVAYQTRVKVAILTSERIADLWKQRRSEDKRFEELLSMTDGLLSQTIDYAIAEEYAKDICNWLSNDYGDRDENLSTAEFFTLACALETLKIALALDSFEGVAISEQDHDSDLDPWCSDPPKYAVMALSGPEWEENSDSAKRQEFWRWWLHEAIPSVLEGNIDSK